MSEITLGYLGPEGTYTHAAAERYVSHYKTDNNSKLVAFPDIPGIIEAVSTGGLTQGIVPAENSIEGTVNLTLDLLTQETALYLQGEIVLTITHHLLTFMNDLREIQTVMSHPQALAQCRSFLKENLPHVTLLNTASTAEAVRLLTTSAPTNQNHSQNHTQKGSAAIASRASHQHYQVPILAENIGDFSHNQTRFLLIGRDPFSPATPTEKTTFVIFPHHNLPGQLYEILGTFAKYGVNLSKIESRPVKKALGRYLFWIDCELGREHPALPAIFADLKKQTDHYHYLGSYPVYV